MSQPKLRETRTSDIRELTALKEHESVPPAEAAGRGSAGAALTNFFNKSLVAAYKFVGFGLLTIILLGLFAYVALNGLFFLHHGWVAPSIIAPSDLRVIELRAKLAHELWNRQKVEAELAQVQSSLGHARRTSAMEAQYQETFQSAVSKSASFKWGRMKAFRKLETELESVQAQLRNATAEFSSTHKESVDTAYAANLIDRQQKATEDFRMAELHARKVQLEQQKTDLDNQLQQLAQQATALGSVAKGAAQSAPATFEGLQLKRSYMTSVLEAARAKDEATALESAQLALQEALKGYDSVVSIIKESPLLLAASGELTVAFVPYENLERVNPGDPVYGCWARVVGCSVVGRVGEAVEGEVTAKHPIYGSDLRGKFVRLELDEETWAKQPVLHVDRPPLFL